MIVVSDASALIALARIGRLDLLRQLAAQVRVPEAVYREVSEAGRSRPGSEAISGAAWIPRSAVSDRAAVARLRDRLGAGEAEVIVLARELPADLMILDDATARRVAEAPGLKVWVSWASFSMRRSGDWSAPCALSLTRWWPPGSSSTSRCIAPFCVGPGRNRRQGIVGARDAAALGHRLTAVE